MTSCQSRRNDETINCCVGGWIRALRQVFLPPDELIRTGRDHGNEMKDETAIQLRLDKELTWDPVVGLSSLVVILSFYVLIHFPYNGFFAYKSN